MCPINICTSPVKLMYTAGNRCMPWLKNYLHSRARSHKNLCPTGMRARLNVEPWYPVLTNNGHFINFLRGNYRERLNFHTKSKNKVQSVHVKMINHISCRLAVQEYVQYHMTVSPSANTWRLCNDSDLILSQAFQPTAAQLSNESCATIGWKACDCIRSLT